MHNAYTHCDCICQVRRVFRVYKGKGNEGDAGGLSSVSATPIVAPVTSQIASVRADRAARQARAMASAARGTRTLTAFFAPVPRAAPQVWFIIIIIIICACVPFCPQAETDSEVREPNWDEEGIALADRVEYRVWLVIPR
jgi:hypothetical protein